MLKEEAKETAQIRDFKQRDLGQAIHHIEWYTDMDNPELRDKENTKLMENSDSSLLMEISFIDLNELEELADHINQGEMSLLSQFYQKFQSYIADLQTYQNQLDLKNQELNAAKNKKQEVYQKALELSRF